MQNPETTSIPATPPGARAGRARTRGPVQEHVYDGGRTVSPLAALRELWRYREVLVAFTSRTLRLRYKQTVLGVGWVVLQPLVFLGVFVLVFGRAADISGGGVAYAAFALTALVGWTFVSSAVSLAAGALIFDAGLMRKVYFPRETPVVGAIASFLPDVLIGVALALLLAPLTGASLGLSLVLVPLLVLALLVPAAAVALPLSALSVYYRDFRYIVPFGMQLWLFASPVAYPVTTVPSEWRVAYALLNPVVGPLEALRRVLALGTWPDWSLLGLSALSGLGLLAGGFWFFKRLERQFADVV